MTTVESAAVREATAQRSVPASWYRGGTSKCWIFRAADLPADPLERDAVLLRAFGSPDFRQVDGVGGATSTTSKAMVVEPDITEPGLVRYQFAQVSIDRPAIEWDSNCGNCATGLALYAVESELVERGAERTTVRLLNTITGLELVTVVDTPGGAIPSPGDTVVPGTPFPGPSVALKFDRSSWSSYGSVLPSGNAEDVLEADGLIARATLVDAGVPAAFMLASDLGMTARETPDEFNARIQDFFALRSAARAAMNLDGLGPDAQSVPKIGIISPAKPGEDVDLHARMVSMTAVHPAIGVTSAIAVAAAAGIPGSIVDQVLGGLTGSVLRIGTLAGPIKLELERAADGSVVWAMVHRSARHIAEAIIYVP
jgi:2-methylaconitate cis-trans-isomerase PrpF